MEKIRVDTRGKSSKQLKELIEYQRHEILLKKRYISELREKVILIRKQHKEQLLLLKSEVKIRDKEITNLNKQLTERKDKVREVLNRKAKGWTRTVKTPLTTEAKRLEKIVQHGAPKRSIENLEYVTRTAKFINERKLTMNDFSLITRAEVLGNVNSTHLGVTYRKLNKLTEDGYLSFSNSVGAKKYWFVSLKGKDLLKDYRNYLSFSKSILKD